MLSADTNLFIQAADPHSVFHTEALAFFSGMADSGKEFVICELVLVELYMQLRNPAVFKKNAYTATQAADYCSDLRNNGDWRYIDYDSAVSPKLWKWASATNSGFREIIDARLALTLRHH